MIAWEKFKAQVATVIIMFVRWHIALQIISLTQQLALLQSMNSKASRPFALEMTNVSGRTEASLEKRMSQYTEWQGAEINRQPYIDAYAGRKDDLVSVSC